MFKRNNILITAILLVSSQAGASSPAARDRHQVRADAGVVTEADRAILRVLTKVRHKSEKHDAHPWFAYDTLPIKQGLKVELDHKGHLNRLISRWGCFDAAPGEPLPAHLTLKLKNYTGSWASSNFYKNNDYSHSVSYMGVQALIGTNNIISNTTPGFTSEYDVVKIHSIEIPKPLLAASWSKIKWRDLCYGDQKAAAWRKICATGSLGVEPLQKKQVEMSSLEKHFAIIKKNSAGVK